MPGYDPRWFLSVHPGDLLNKRYKILAKVGWGMTSTVWLAQDTLLYVTIPSDMRSDVSTDGGGTPTVTSL